MLVISMKKFNPVKFKKIFTYLCLVAYIGCATTLIVEASMNGVKSANQSNTVGGGIADIINDAGGDTSIAIEPTSVSINNKIDKAYVGDTYQLETSVTPENATFQSLKFVSSDTSIACISDTGYIRFIKEGEVDFSISNLDYPDLTDTFRVNVLPVNVESINVTLSYVQDGNIVELNKNSDNKYDLWLDTQYKINVEFLPTNATYKTYNFSYSSNNFSISDNIIIPSKTSSDYEEITIYSSINTSIEVKIIDNPNTFVPFEKLEFSSSSIPSISLATTLSFSDSKLLPKYNNGTSIPTYKDIEYSIEDTSIAKINSTNSGIEGKAEGTTNVIIRSVKYPEFSAIKQIKVEFIKINSFALTLGSFTNTASVTVDYTGTLKTNKISPYNYSYNSYINNSSYFTKTFTSSDPSVVSVTSAGKIKALKVGTSTLTMKLTDIKGNEVSSSITVTVKEKPLPPEPIQYSITKINYENSLNEFEENDGNNYMIINKTYNLDNYFTISSIEGTNTNIAPKNKQIKINSLFSPSENMYIDSSKFTNYVTISGNNFTFKNKCIVEFYFVHIDSNFTTYYNNNEFTFRVTAPVYKPSISLDTNALDDSLELMEDNYNIETKISKSYTLTFPYIYGLEVTSSPNFKTKYENINTRTVLYITPLKEGKLTIKIKPSYLVALNDIDYTKTFTITSSHITIDDLNYTLKVNDEQLVSTNINENHQQIYQRFTSEVIDLELNYDYQETPTAISTIITSSNPTIVSVGEDNKLTLKKAGKSLITIKDKISLVEKTFQVNVYNIIKLQEDNLIVRGKINKKDDDGTLHIYTASSIKITPNFTEDTTFKMVTYSSKEDEKETEDKILEIGNDGTITTIQQGSTEIYLSVNDSFTPSNNETKNGPFKLTIKIQVDKKPLINEENISNFLLLIRKSLGHFGAFFVLGICSTLFFMLQFDKEKWFYSIPINFLQGLSIASLTELIQIFVEGRSGLVKDVWIDYSGFTIAAVLITIGILAYHFIKKLIKKKKEKKDLDNK